MEKIYDYCDVSDLIIKCVYVYDYSDFIYFTSILDENDNRYTVKVNLKQLYALQEKTDSFHYLTNFHELYDDKDF